MKKGEAGKRGGARRLWRKIVSPGKSVEGRGAEKKRSSGKYGR
jgi:hypothetical protein